MASNPNNAPQGARAWSQQAGSSRRYAYPLTQKGPIIATPSDHASRAFGNWMSDNAVDIGVPPNTGVRAVDDSVVSRLSGSAPNPSGNPAGWTVYLTSKENNNEYAYMHLNSYSVKKGDRLAKGEVFGRSGTANGVPHLHFASLNGNPMDIVGEGEEGDSGGSGNLSSNDVGSSLDEATAKAAAFATYFNIEGLSGLIESEALTGERSLMNDKPLLPFIQQLCSASLRRFQSMPNGNFFAFYPDYFGGMNHRTPYWEISDLEIIDGQIELSDDPLATHVYVVGDTDQFAFFDGVDINDKANTAGVVTLFSALQSNFITGSSKKEKFGKAVEDLFDATAFLQKYGARPYYDEAPMVRSAFYEAFLAYQKFLLLWSQQFATHFSLTFMPELFPGGLVKLPQHNLQLFVEEVTHTFDFETGFNTDVVFSSPASLDKKGKTHEGMIRSEALKPNVN